jgi:hypothetical protein
MSREHVRDQEAVSASSGNGGSSRALPASRLLGLRIRVPQHIVYRSFVSETVVLNLETGRYHGLNQTGGRMLQALEKSGVVRDAAAELAGEYGLPDEQINRDLCEFCDDLLARGLIEVDEVDRADPQA